MTKFLTYVKSSCITLHGSMFGHSHYIYCLEEESTHSGPRVSKNIGLETMKHFEPQTSQKKNRQRLWCYTKSSHIIICSKMFQYLQNHILLRQTKITFTASRQILLSVKLSNKIWFYSFFFLISFDVLLISCHFLK